MKQAVLRTLLALIALGALLVAVAPWLPDLSSPSPGRPAGPPAWTQERLDGWITGSRAAWLTLAFSKGLPVLLGIAFVVQELLRADRAGRGAQFAAAAGSRLPDLPQGPTAVATPGGALGLGILLPLGVQLVAGSLFVRAPGESTRGGLGPLEFGVAVTCASLALPALLVVLRRARLGAGRLPSVRTGLVEGLRYTCIALLLVVPVGLVWALTLEARGVELHVQPLVQKFAEPDWPAQPWIVAVFGAFIAPFTEEAVFRGLLYPALRTRMPGGAFGAAVAVSVLFAAIHGSLLAFLPLFVLAMVLAGVMEKTNSLLACYVVHALHNATSLAPMMVRVFQVQSA